MKRSHGRGHVADTTRSLGLLLLLALTFLAARPLPTAGAQPPPSPSPTRIVELTGIVEVSDASGQVWSPARITQEIPVGARLRTRSQSRATLQFSDRSVLRLGPDSLVVVQPPRAPPAIKRFRLNLGRLFFLDRESPSDIEFETPVASGAIRGTEFVLTTSADATSLALLDGEVELVRDADVVRLASGEEVELAPGQAPQVRRILLAANLVQWCLQYPAILAPDDLSLTGSERERLAGSLDAWRRGNALAALQIHPGLPPNASVSALLYRAALGLAVGDVAACETSLASLAEPHPLADALREVIAAVRFETLPRLDPPDTASGWLARSYYLQSRSALPEALAAAREASRRAPAFGPVWIRIAELEHSFDNRRAATAALDQGLALAPECAPGHALRGFVALAALQTRDAEAAFDHALELDGASGNAWLGRALTQGQRGRTESARRSLQIAAALEPNQAELRSYLGKAWAAAGDAIRASEELALAKTLDPGDPTPWLYSALERFQGHQPNDAVRHLERSIDLNDHRGVFRSRLLLDQDRATRQADLAALFQTVGLQVPSRLLAARAIQEDLANASAHLLLAQSLQQREDPLRANLRFETARQSELLLANLLAPPGSGNLSQQLSQQDHLRYFGPRPFALSTFTQYQSNGDWDQLATAFGAVDGLAYALDFQYLSHAGEHPNADLDRRQVSVQAKQRVGPADEVYLQVGMLHSESGDVFQYADPSLTDPDLRVQEDQEPHLHAGWHHLWSPAHHTLVLASWLQDRLSLSAPGRPIPFLRQTGGIITGVDSQRAVFDLDQQSEFTLRSLQFQHLWESNPHGLLAGARYQSGDIDTEMTLAGPLPPPPLPGNTSSRPSNGSTLTQITSGAPSKDSAFPAASVTSTSATRRTPISRPCRRSPPPETCWHRAPAPPGPPSLAPTSGSHTPNPSADCITTTASAWNPPRSPASPPPTEVWCPSRWLAWCPAHGSKPPASASTTPSPTVSTPAPRSAG